MKLSSSTISISGWFNLTWGRGKGRGKSGGKKKGRKG